MSYAKKVIICKFYLFCNHFFFNNFNYKKGGHPRAMSVSESDPINLDNIKNESIKQALRKIRDIIESGASK